MSAITCLFTNAQSIVNKLPELQAVVCDHSPLIVGIAESWCTSSVGDAELHLNGYNLFRDDRPSGIGGGVLLYVHSSLSATPCKTLSDVGFENSLWCSITLSPTEVLLVGVVYRAPSSSNINNQNLTSIIGKLHEQANFTNLLIMGDFNFPAINWVESYCTGSDSSAASLFFDTVQDSFLVQHVTSNTRHRQGQQSSLLDLIFTLDPNSVDDITHLSPLGSSDHVCLLWKYKCFDKVSSPKKNVAMYNYRKGDYEAMNDYLGSINWCEILSGNVHNDWQVFKAIVQEAMVKYIPTSIPKKNKTTPSWWSKSIDKAIKAKQQAFAKFKHSKSRSDYANYAAKRNNVKCKIRSTRKCFEQSLLVKLRSNPKALYSYIKSKQKICPSIGPLEKSDGSLTVDDEETAEALNQFFESTFTREDSSNIPVSTSVSEDSICDIDITESLVLQKLLELKVNKAPGPDGLHSYVLKACASTLSLPLTILYTRSLSGGVLPAEWKQAHVVPIFKKGQRNKASNYRPISLTSIVVKVLESIIRSELVNFFDERGVLTGEQHGFVNRKSCFTNLLSTFEEWTSALDQGFGIDVIFLDYSKAFDSVPHHRLISKLSALGVRGNLSLWLSNFLSNRFQRVVLNGHLSSWAQVVSGVPQGSVLGPLLFILYVNDIPDLIKCNVRMFADDTKIYSVIRSFDDHLRLQSDVNQLLEWSHLWLLRFNIAKCKFMRIGNSAAFPYSMFDSTSNLSLEISEVQEEKDLGIWCTKDLKPSLQCRRAAAKAMQVLGLLRRSFKHVSGDLLTFLYKMYVRPHLEYCIQVWSPYLAKDIDLLEKVQRRATKLLPSLSNLPYESRLEKLDLYSLYCRRKRGDLIETYKILNGYYDIDSTSFFTFSNTTTTRGHHHKLFRYQSRLLLRHNFFTNRVVSSWNSLPEHVVSAPSVALFKKKLDDFWQESGYGHSQRPAA